MFTDRFRRAPAKRAALYGIFATWFGVTVFGQKLYRSNDRVSVWDKLYLVVPDWRFFAPDPGVFDHHLLMRDELADGAFTGFQEITSVEERKPSHALWHPHRRAEKTVFDVETELLRQVRRSSQTDGAADEKVQLSVPYLTLLAHVTAQDHHPEAVRTQFLICVSGGYDESEDPVMVFLSQLHDLEPTGEPAPSTGAAS